MTQPAPFWKTKTLEELSPEEWESLCDRCGRCCMLKVRGFDSDTRHHTDIACRMLDLRTGQCSDYANRLKLVPWCDTLTPVAVRGLTWLPTTCGYRRVAEGQDLAWWHPLVSGDPDTVRQAGISVRGRAIPEAKSGKLEYHVVSWPGAPTDAGGTPAMRWRALSGGTNADLLTPLRPDLSIDLDRMAVHALRVLELGCDGMRVLGRVGEGDAFNMEERIAALEGLAARDVPMSRIMPDIRGANAVESLEMARRAADLGCRVVILSMGQATGQARGHDGPEQTEHARQMAERLPGGIHIYLDVTDQRDETADEALPAAAPLFEMPLFEDARIQGILTTGPRAAILAARVTAEGKEVYGDDSADLHHLLRQGGAGCISALANVASRLPAFLCRDWDHPGAAVAQSVMRAVAQSLATAPLVPGLKALLARQTGEEDWLTVRPPLKTLPEARRLALFAAYDAARARPRA